MALAGEMGDLSLILRGLRDDAMIDPKHRPFTTDVEVGAVLKEIGK